MHKKLSQIFVALHLIIQNNFATFNLTHNVNKKTFKLKKCKLPEK
jgi:hypothetical protein